MNKLKEKSLGLIVAENHRAAVVFEKYHLDFCCKGKRTLQQACQESSLQVEEITAALESSVESGSCTVAPNFSRLSMAQLIHYIVSTHHDYVKQEMPVLCAWLQRVVSKHGERHPEMVKVFYLFDELMNEMTEHMKKEELVLFPRIQEVEAQSVSGNKNEHTISFLQSPIQMMEHEHDHAGNLLDKMDELTNDFTPPADACTTFRLALAGLKAFEMDLHQHVHLENNILFPKAIELFKNNPNTTLN